MQRTIDLTLSVLVSVVAFFLSWPFWRSFQYWADSYVAWWIYFALGFVLVVYVFYVFLGSLHILFLHDTQQSADPAATDPGTATDKGQRP